MRVVGEHVRRVRLGLGSDADYIEWPNKDTHRFRRREIVRVQRSKFAVRVLVWSVKESSVESLFPMAAPQQPYPHPGPSSYYPPPPQPYPYPPTHTPYQYQYPIPQLSSPRVNQHPRPYPPSRPGPSYQNYQPHPPTHHHHYSYPQHSPHSPGPYPPPTQQHPLPHNKYHPPPVTYSPNYPIHPSSPYPSTWQPQQPLSPLPKQLSMLPPLSLPSQQPDLQRQSDSTPTPDSDHADHHPIQNSPPSPSHSPRTSSVSVSSTPSSPLLSSDSSPQTMSSTSPEYVIWSKRPTNPSSAPGIIISPRARPPDDVIQKALVLPSPPPSPPSTEVALPDRTSTPTPPDHADVPSSAETETTPATSTAPDTSVPASPVSTNTSLSAAESPEKPRSDVPPQPERVPTPHPEETPVPTESPAVSEPAPAPAPVTVPAPVPPKPTGPKPTWASLLRKDPTKPNALPTSSIVGFSIPASALSTTPTHPPIPPSKKPELLSLLTSGPSSQPSMKIRPRGLVNTGNMCFANAVLQVLIYCPPFWRLFHELGRFLDTPADGDISSSKTPLVDATVKFLREFIPGSKVKAQAQGKGKGVDRAFNGNGYEEEEEEESAMDSFIPTYVYDALKEKKRFDHMRGGHQEDAEEFLGFYLDTLEEELLSITTSLTSKPDATSSHNGHANANASAQNVPTEDGPWLEVGKRNRMAVTRTSKSTESPITRMFGGKFRSTLKVPHQKDSVLVEDWRSLRLDIQREQIHTIKDALTYISSPQPVQVTSVTRPGATLDGTQTVHIESLPPILILHLKRFLYDASAGGVGKVGKQVGLVGELDVPSEVMAAGKKIHSTRYKLFGVLYHHGLSASGGHYTLDVLHPNIDNISPTSTSGSGSGAHSGLNAHTGSGSPNASTSASAGANAGASGKPREAWIRIDDELVSDIRPEDVFGVSERDDRCAYLVFYRRVGSARS